jgi:soluble lytic murein transglycosylase-like protein
MNTRSQQLFIQGTFILIGALVVSGIGGWVRGASADSSPPALSEAAMLLEIRSLRQDVDAKQGELDVVRLQLERMNAILAYSSRYRIAADLTASVYDIALSEGLTPDVAFAMVRLESAFDTRAKSHAGALGLTQVLPSTARLYEPGLTDEQLYDRDTNLRIGFRYLVDLLERYEGDMERALLAYNRGPARVQELIDRGDDPSNGYETTILRNAGRR